MPKISSLHQFILDIQPILESHDQTGHTHFWPHPPKIFWSTLNLCKFVSTCKKSGYFINLLWRYGWLKNSAIWLAENILVHISGTKFFQNMGLCRNTANNINFHYRTNSVKINDKICFWPIFAPFSRFFGQENFFWKIGSCHAQLHIGF